jgi:hypothetical protein
MLTSRRLRACALHDAPKQTRAVTGLQTSLAPFGIICCIRPILSRAPPCGDRNFIRANITPASEPVDNYSPTLGFIEEFASQEKKLQSALNLCVPGC